MSETLEGLKGRLGTLKRALESKWLRADAMKTKMMISNENAERQVAVTEEGQIACAFAERARH